MNDWSDVARDSFRAAEILRREGRYRSSVSRSYYAAFSALTGALAEQGMKFAAGRDGPKHKDLPALVREHLMFQENNLYAIRKAVRILYKARLGSGLPPEGDRK